MNPGNPVAPPGALDPEGPARLLARPDLARVLAVLEGGGERVRIVGGAVRDALLGRPVADIDLTTTALPEETMRRARAAGLRAVPTGLDHGTVTVVAAGGSFEVTTLREDVETDGRRARVRFGRNFEADARRRDFTVNALALDPAGGLHDPTGGLSDLAAGRVRFVGDPRTRIREDYLRTLRFFRFHARYGAGPPDAEGLAAAVALREGLDGLSRERVRAELLKLVAAPGAAGVLAVLSDTGLLGRLIAGIGDLGRFERAGGTDAVRGLAALAVFARGDAERLRGALRLTNAEAERLAAYADALAALRGPDDPLGPADLRRLAARHGATALGDALAALAGEPRPVLEGEAGVLARAFVAGEAPAPVFPLRGADFVARGVPPGAGVGRALAAARTAWLHEGCPEGDEVVPRLIAAGLAAESAGAPSPARGWKFRA